MGVLVMAGGEGIWNTMELPPSRLAASKCPLDTCIELFKSRFILKIKNTHPFGWVFLILKVVTNFNAKWTYSCLFVKIYAFS